MRMFFTKRWLGFAIIVSLTAIGCVKLGEWQMHRLAEREAKNSAQLQNENQAAIPVTSVMSTVALTPKQEWTKVSLVGSWLPNSGIVVRYRTLKGKAGIGALAAVKLTSGETVIVDRGWLATPNNAQIPKLPPLATGKITITGYARSNGTGNSTQVTSGSTRAINSLEIGKALGINPLVGFVQLANQNPVDNQQLIPGELPEISNGPHFFYALQWWFFGVLALALFGYLFFDERRKLQTAK